MMNVQSIGWFVFEMFINLLEGIMFTYFIYGSLSFRKDRKGQKLSFALCSLCIFTAFSVLNYITYFEGIAIFIYAGIMLTFSIVFLNGNFLKKLIVSLLPISFLAIVSIFSTNLMSAVFDIPIMELMSKQTIYRLATVLFANLVLFALIYFVRAIIKNEDASLAMPEWIMIGAVLCISIIAFMFLYFAIFEGVSEIGRTFIAASIICLIMMNVAIYYLLVKLSRKHRFEMENNLLKQNYELQSKSAEEMKKQYSELQKARHDFKNTLRVIQALSSEGKAEQIDSYISQYISESGKSLQNVSIDNDYINAIINLKLSEAYSAEIQTKLSLPSELNNVDNVDICNLLGNMFDNAIEACRQCKGEKILELELSQRGGETAVVMKNSVSAPVLTDNPQLNTVKKNKRNHGYGTRIIKDIAKKNHGFADFYEEDGFFCCRVILNYA